jgi:hypothetical protein
MAEPEFNLDTALHWGEFVAVLAQMEHRGVPIDMEIYPQLRDKHTWAYVRDAMVPAIDAQYGVYVRGKDGEWHFSNEQFQAYLDRSEINWPRHDSTKLDMRRKTFESMAKAPCYGPSQRKRRARSRKPPSGFSPRQSGCDF